MKQFFYRFIFFLIIAPACFISLSVHSETKLDKDYRKDWSDLDEHAVKRLYGSERDEKFPVKNPLFQVEKWENRFSVNISLFYKYTDYPKFKSHRFLFPPAPLFYTLKSKVDNRKKNWLFPFWYYRRSGDRSTVITPAGFLRRDHRKSSESGSLSARYYSLFYLFYSGSRKSLDSQGNRYGRKYSALFPVYWHRSYGSLSTDQREIKKREFLSLLGTYESRSDAENGKLKESKRKIISPFYISETLKKCEEECEKPFSLQMLPALPFLYFSKKTANEDIKNVLTLLHWKKRNNELKRLWLMPFVFSGKLDSFNANYFHFFPLVANFWKKEDRFSAFFPFVVFWKIGSSRKGLYTPVFQYQKIYDRKNILFLYPLFHYAADSQKLKKLWLPLSYYKRNSYYHLFPFWFSWKDREASTKTALAPGYFSRTSPGKTMRLYGPVWKRNDTEKKTSSFHIHPISYYWKKDQDDHEKGIVDNEKRIINPLFIYRKKEFQSPDQSDVITQKDLFFPVLPLFYKGSHSQHGSAYKFLFIYDFRFNDEGKLTKSWFFPVFYKKESYFHVFPFFFRPNAKNIKRGVSFGPLHYHRWSPEEDHRWVFLHYGRFSKDSDDFVSHYLPLYYSWKTEFSRGKIFAPVYLEYEDKNKYIKLVFAYWNQKSAGYLNPDLGIGRSRGRWYLDGDVSFLYNLFRIQSRVSMPVPQKYSESQEDVPDVKTVSSMISEIGENVLDEAQTAKDETTGKPLISKKEGLKRNHANYYFGWEALFGILSYARSDTKRHFRMLPLGWFTWDKASNDRVVLFPPFLPLYFHYNSENLEYRVIFPFYAKQRKGRSYIKSYLFIAFLSEYNEEEDLREYSVLWPFINFYRSPVRNGSRFLPFYHYRSILKDQVRTERLLSPVYFKKKVISYEDTEEKKILSEKSMSISPFHFSSEFKDKIEKRKITAFPVLPLYMKITHDVRLKDQDLDKNFMENPSDSKPEPDEAYYRKKSLTYLFPAFFSTQKVSRSGRKKKQIFFAPFIPLYFKSKVQLYSRENPKQLESEKAIKITPFYSVLESKNAYGETRSTGIPFIPLFGKNERIYYSENNEMPQEKAESAPQTEQASNKKVFRTDHSHYLFPFYYFKRKNFEGKETDQTILLVPILPLYARWNTNAGVSKWMFGLYTFRGYDGLKKNNFLYLAETSSHKDTSAFSMHFLFRSVHYRKDSEQKRFKLLYGILANYRKNKDSGDYQFDALASLYRQKKSSSLFQFHLLPLFYYKKQPERSTLFALGYYSKKRPEYRRRNFLYLYDHEWNGFSKKNRYSFLLGSVRFQKKYNSKNIRLLWGPGMNYSWSSKTKNYNFTALAYLYGQKRTENVFKNYLFPFYYLKNIKNDSKLFMLPYLPVLAYSKTSYGYGFTENDKTKFSKNLYLMGILWYSRQHLFYDENGNLSAQYGNRKHLLLGGIYYNFENFEEKKAKKGILWGAVYGYKRKPLRGYESRGSLWGVLWKYETEKDTGYKKFSILKFLYSDTTKANGERYIRIFGVKVKSRKKDTSERFLNEDYRSGSQLIGSGVVEHAAQTGFL